MNVRKSIMKITPFSGRCGAEITNVDLTTITSGETQAIRQAYLDHQVLVIRNQTLTPQEQSDFSAKFGPLETQKDDKHAHPDNDRVTVVLNEIRANGASFLWHSDSSYREIPVALTIFQSVVNSAYGGGTDFCNMHAAYDALSDKLKERIAGLHGVHCRISKSLEPEVVVSEAEPKVLQPLVRTHEDSGRQALYVSPRFTVGIDGMDDEQAQALLNELFAVINEPSRPYHHLHKYSAGDLILWDNRSLVHRAMGGYKLPDTRRMHRTTVAGVVRPFYRQ